MSGNLVWVVVDGFLVGIEPIGACLFDAECVEVEIQKRAVDLIRDVRSVMVYWLL